MDTHTHTHTHKHTHPPTHTHTHTRVDGLGKRALPDEFPVGPSLAAPQQLNLPIDLDMQLQLPTLKLPINRDMKLT